jgi:hypothetical protein
MGAKLFHADRQTDTRTVMTEEKVDLCSFVNAPKRAVVAYYVVLSWHLCGKTGEILDEALGTIGASFLMRNMQLPKAKEERS